MIERLDSRSAASQFSEGQAGGRPIAAAPSDVEAFGGIAMQLVDTGLKTGATRKVKEAADNMLAARELSEKGSLPNMSEAQQKSWDKFTKKNENIKRAAEQGRINDTQARILYDQAIRKEVNKFPYLADHYKKVAYEMTGVQIGSELERRIFNNDPDATTATLTPEEKLRQSLIDEYRREGMATAEMDMAAYQQLTTDQMQSINAIHFAYRKAIDLEQQVHNLDESKRTSGQQKAANAYMHAFALENESLLDLTQASYEAIQAQLSKGQGNFAEWAMTEAGQAARSQFVGGYASLIGKVNSAIDAQAGNPAGVKRLTAYKEELEARQASLTDLFDNKNLMQSLIDTNNLEVGSKALNVLMENPTARQIISLHAASGTTPDWSSFNEAYLTSLLQATTKEDEIKALTLSQSVGSIISAAEQGNLDEDALRNILKTNASFAMPMMLNNPNIAAADLAKFQAPLEKVYTVLTVAKPEDIKKHFESVLPLIDIPMANFDKLPPSTKDAYAQMLKANMYFNREEAFKKFRSVKGFKVTQDSEGFLVYANPPQEPKKGDYTSDRDYELASYNYRTMKRQADYNLEKANAINRRWLNRAQDLEGKGYDFSEFFGESEAVGSGSRGGRRVTGSQEPQNTGLTEEEMNAEAPLDLAGLDSRTQDQLVKRTGKSLNEITADDVREAGVDLQKEWDARLGTEYGDRN